MPYGLQYDILKCPFCDKGDISCMWYPAATSVKRSSSSSLPGSKNFHKSKEEWIIQSGCSVCRKSNEEVEKELKRKGII